MKKEMYRKAEEKKDRKMRVVEDVYSFYSREEQDIREAEAREYLASLSEKLK